MKFLAFNIFCLFFALNVSANTQIDAACEKKLIKAAIKNKETNVYFLEYEVQKIVRSDLFNDYVEVTGFYMDAEEDFSYTEVYEVGVTKGTCDIKSVEVVEVIEN
ncbi:hypothetical protein K2X05_05155 [bacterium]|nr:hypothetical protein [bacterium]